jgi:hypothetical protein
MPFIRFTGFPPGGAVSLTATQGGASDSATIAQWGVPTSGASLTIQTRRAPQSARFAPEAVFFEAEPAGFDLQAPAGPAWYRPEMHEIAYEWTFGDTGAVYTATENTVAEWKDANRAFGQCVAHVFSQPGTYTVTCTARKVVSLDPVEVHEATAITTVTVAAQASLFAPAPAGAGTVARTIAVALDGDFTGADPSWAQATNETPSDNAGWSEMGKNLLEDLNNADDPADQGYLRILFKRGETYTVDLAQTIMRWTNAPLRMIVAGTWGDPAAPPPKAISFSAGPNPNLHGYDRPAWIIDGIDFEGDYDSYTETAGPTAGTAISHPNGPYMLVTNCRIRKHNSGTYWVTNPADRLAFPNPQFVIHNTEMSELAQYGLFQVDQTPDQNTDYGWWAMLGCKDVDVGDAFSGGGDGNDGTFTNSQGPVRSTTRGLAIVDGCDFFGRYGWSGGGTYADGVGISAAQAPLRLFSDATHLDTGRAFVTRSAFEGAEIISCGSTPSAPPPSGNLLVDQFLHVAIATARQTVNSQMGCLTVRNGLAINPAPAAEVPPYLYFVQLDFLKNAGNEPTADQLSAPVRVYNNTVIDFDATEAAHAITLLYDRDGVFTGELTAENNLVYTPNYPAQAGHLDFAPFDATELFAVRWLGRLELGDNGVLQTDYAAPAGSVSLYAPQPGSPALGTVTSGPVAVFDLRGRRRGAVPATGALEAG